MKTVSIINQKGGVGKSTTVAALAAGLATKKKRVLVIDMDAQCNLSYTFGANLNSVGSYALLDSQRGMSAAEIIQNISNNLDIIPGSVALGMADTTITATGKEFRLRESLEPIKDMYDFCIVDTPPALGIATINSLTVSDGIVIAAMAEIYSAQGISQLMQTVSLVRQYCNRELKIYGILLCRYNDRTVVRRSVARQMSTIAENIGSKLFESRIRDCTAVVEAQAQRKNIFEYSPSCNAAKDYQSFVLEFLKTVED